MAQILTRTHVPTLITEGSQVQGNLRFQIAAQVHGVVEGDIHHESKDPLTIGRSGWVKGTIHSQGPVIVEGRVEGDIHSHSKIRLTPTAAVQGTLRSTQIDIRPGAKFEGVFQMSQLDAVVSPRLLQRAA